MIRDDDAVDAILHAQRGILGREDAFQKNAPRSYLTQTRDDVPIQVRGTKLLGGHLRARIHGFAAQVFRRIDVAQLAIAGIDAGAAKLRFTIGRCGIIRRNDHCSSAGGFGAAHQLLRDVPLGRRIDLRPQPVASCLSDLFDRRRRDGGQDLQMIAGACRTCRSQLAVLMHHELAADGRECDRRRPAGAEQLHTRIDMRDLDQAPRANEPLVERAQIGTHGLIVVRSGIQISEMRGRQTASRQPLEFTEAQHLLRGGH